MTTAKIVFLDDSVQRDLLRSGLGELVALGACMCRYDTVPAINASSVTQPIVVRLIGVLGEPVGGLAGVAGDGDVPGLADG